jgi:uncharacterized protein YjbI with pentapeptide repeats
MQIDSETFVGSLGRSPGWDENAFFYCSFERVSQEGLHVSSVFLDCRFQKCDWYWALFNVATFIGAKFENCVFRGCSFAECRFVECEFVDCDFTVDSFGKPCSFDGTRWYSCKQHTTNGLDGFSAVL